MSNKVCIAVDNSACSAAALRWASSRMVQPDDELVIVHVVQPTSAFPSPTGDPAVPWLRPTREAVEASNELVASLAQQAQRMGVQKVRTAVVHAPVGSAEGVGMTLRDVAERERPDLMVLGSRGLGSITRVLLGSVGLGSVSTFAVNQLPCPVVVHKTRAGAPGGASQHN